MVLALASAGVAAVLADGGGSDAIGGDGEIAPPPTVESDTTRPALNSFRLPGTGTVTSIVEVGGDLVAVAAGDHWGSSIWRLDDASGTWQVTDGLPGIAAVDAVAHPRGLAVVGYYTLDRSPVLLVGPVTDLQPTPLELGTAEVPYEIDLVTDALVVSARFGDGSTGATSSTYLIDEDVRARRLGAPNGFALIDGVLSRGGDVIAFGSASGRPAMWTVGADGILEPIEIDLGLESGRIAAAAEVGGEFVGLVIDGFGTELASTSVYQLEPPFDVLDEPIPGAWDRLVPGDDEVLALPNSFSALPDGALSTYRTPSGIAWVAGRTRFVPPGGEDRGEQTMLIEDAVFRDAGALVVAGTASVIERFPVVASEGGVGSSFEVPSSPTSLVDPDAGGVDIVHIGGIQLALRDDVVMVRTDFGEPWVQPVFADEPSVGGVVDVVELDFGYLLSSTRPYRALWYSSDGNAWQLIAGDVIQVAGSGASALAISSRDGESAALTVGPSGVAELETAFLPIGDRLGHVLGVGYVAGPVEGAVYVSDTGADWTALDVGAAVDAVQFGDGAVAVLADSRWLRYDEAGGMSALLGPDGEPVPPRQTFIVDGGLFLWDRSGFSVTSDFVDWTEVPLGAWEGADGPLVHLEVGENEVIAQLGSEAAGSIFALRR